MDVHRNEKESQLTARLSRLVERRFRCAIDFQLLLAVCLAAPPHNIANIQQGKYYAVDLVFKRAIGSDT